jgi:hypothetical protein
LFFDIGKLPSLKAKAGSSGLGPAPLWLANAARPDPWALRKSLISGFRERRKLLISMNISDISTNFKSLALALFSAR